VAARSRSLRGNATGLWTVQFRNSDIENSSSRDWRRNSRPSVRDVRHSSPETGPFTANPRECRHSCEHRKRQAGDQGQGQAWRRDRPLRPACPRNLPAKPPRRPCSAAGRSPSFKVVQDCNAYDLHPPRGLGALAVQLFSGLLGPRSECKNRTAKGREVYSLPIRLRHTPATCWVRPVAGIKLGVGRRLYITGDAEQRAESVERVEAPVEAKREFVEVGL
jgi:hypothetical protein